MIITSCMLFLFLSSCKKSNPQNSETSEISTNDQIPESFLNFYTRFHSDSIYQKEHIVFPMPQIDSTTLWTEETWIINKPFYVDGTEFNKDIQNVGGIIIEFIYHVQGLYLLERRFSQLSDGDWNLIYYKVTDKFAEEWSEE